MDNLCCVEDYEEQVFASCRKKQYLREKEEHDAEERWEESQSGECKLNIYGMRIEDDGE